MGVNLLEAFRCVAISARYACHSVVQRCSALFCDALVDIYGGIMRNYANVMSRWLFSLPRQCWRDSPDRQNTRGPDGCINEFALAVPASPIHAEHFAP